MEKQTMFMEVIYNKLNAYVQLVLSADGSLALDQDKNRYHVKLSSGAIAWSVQNILIENYFNRKGKERF
jgi:hypothetical protein